jgi:hypothetical protein
VHELAADHDGRGGSDTRALDLVRVLDVDDLDIETRRLRGPFDDAD